MKEYIKLIKKLSRLEALKNPMPRGGRHKTSKKDKKRNNTVRKFED